MKQYLHPKFSDTITKAQLTLLIIIAFLFSLSIRLIWVYQFHGTDPFIWNDQFMINTNDGYYWAEGARDILSGTHQPNDLSPIEMAPAILTAIFAKALPFSFESIIFYMPAVLGSLIVIPIILISRLFGQSGAGFIGAVLASITYSYYNRTMVGYYDTDMLNIVLPLFIVWGILFALIAQRNRYLLIPTLGVIAYGWWYNSSYTLSAALGIGLLLYTLIFERTNKFNYKLIAFYLIGISQIAILLKVLFSLTLFLVFHFEKGRIKHLEYGALALTLIVFLATGGFTPIINLFDAYALRNGSTTTSVATLHFYNVMETVREAGHIPFETLAERISGHVISFFLGLVGYALLLWRYRLMLLTLPLFGLGMFAIWGGLRFTIYAVPLFTLGMGYVIIVISQFVSSKFVKILLAGILTILLTIPNILHVLDYKVPSVMQKNEVAPLVKLKDITTREDYVVTWWDFGYPIRYYADVKTWVDGGKHSGDVNYPASFVLTAQDQLSAAHMMRLYTEYTEKGFTENNKTFSTDFEYMMTKEGYNDPDELLTSIALPEYKLPTKAHNVYLYLPLRMMEIFPTVALFSNLDLKAPDNRQQPFFYASDTIHDNGESIDLGQGISIIKAKNTLKLGAQEVPIKSFYQVGYVQDNKLQTNEQSFASEGLNVIYLASYGKFLVVDDFYLHSTYFQMFIFEHYDKNLFEPVSLDPMTKIYRLKI
ncbi:MAG: STT3 domain-containing protein [Sulfuricurvum sp.]|uniref:STT3 domain-containing protein n=1 Tax=Sulfuricurvum sp. TaxID=2025608 RepID=UPI0026387D9E|nr:STT3 domain-containing protein [Sulfuricurvum sp.]MDD2828062.1 STT3 domain-containing protein [Sulfuricurvum sp.]MDD4948061.1 STT3 domain-containing protein [Sulfuricurvum sp.]